MAKFGSGKKPANQGSHAAPKTAKPKKSSAPARTSGAPHAGQSQTHRGYHVPGNGGSGRGAH